MDYIKKKAYAKINLVLQIIGKMDDGYHSISTIMQSISLFDTITMTKTQNVGINVRCSLPYVPTDERNIVHRAAKLFFGEIGKTDYGIAIFLLKKIPVGAGLGGGSSDAGAVLIGLNELYNGGISSERLMQMGGSLGADVPFTMMGGAAKAKGKGDILSRVTPLKNCHIVVCKPKFSVSTREAFGMVTPEDYGSEEVSERMETLLALGNNLEIAKSLCNTFEKIVASKKEKIHIIKNNLTECGAVGTLMTGSGSAVYGIFTNVNSATDAVKELKKKFQDVYLTQPMQ